MAHHLVVAKSLGTHALPLAATRGLTGIWLTPLLHDPAQVDALRRTGAPALVVGGTADPYWDHNVARELNAGGWSPSAGRRRLVELQGLDHSLEVEGDPQASVDALAVVTAAVATFLDLLATATRTTPPGAPERGSSGSRVQWPGPDTSSTSAQEQGPSVRSRSISRHRATWGVWLGDPVRAPDYSHVPRATSGAGDGRRDSADQRQRRAGGHRG